MRHIFIPILIIIIGVGTIFAVISKPKPLLVVENTEVVAPPKEEVPLKLSYVCKDKAEIQAHYYTDHAKVFLPSGEVMSVPLTASVSGARYATSDKAFVFWNKGSSVSIEENGKLTRESCAEKNQMVSASITSEPIELVEDSRCPAGVSCIQAGTVRVRAKVGNDIEIFTLNQPVSLGGKTITLTQVTPQAQAGKMLSFNEYKFSFSVK